jgi:hypothetical protein
VGAAANLSASGVTAAAYSHGILTGNDDDTILNLGSINSTANTLGEAGGASLGLISMSLVNAFASADIDGIHAGAGDDVITNEGTILAGRIREGDDYLVKGDTEAVSFDLVSLLLVSPGPMHISPVSMAEQAMTPSPTEVPSLSVTKQRPIPAPSHELWS